MEQRHLFIFPNCCGLLNNSFSFVKYLKIGLQKTTSSILEAMAQPVTIRGLMGV